MTAHRIAALLLVATAVAGCGSQNSMTARPAAHSPTIALLPEPSPQFIGVPTPTQAPSLHVGRLTSPIPAGTTTLTVTFLYASDSFATAPADVLFRKTITDAGLIQSVVSQVDALHLDGGATQGCTGSSVNLRLDFAGPRGLATLDENSPCARSTLTVGGTPGPLLDSALADWIEQTLGIKEVLLSNGQPSVQSR